MKKHIAFILALGSCFAAHAQGFSLFGMQEKNDSPVKFDWNVDFQYMFNNYEYDRSHNMFDRSYTLNAARLTPTVGVRIEQSAHVHHHVMIGMDFYKNMGEGVRPQDLRNEMTLFYDIDAFLENGGRFGAVAGMYPRRFLEGDYRGPFFDDSVLFTDCNMEGMAFKYTDEAVHAEIGLDWMGMLGDTENPLRRERFQVLSSGDWNFAGPLHFGWRGSFYHFACSPQSWNVVDNHMLNPWLEWTPECWFEHASLNLGFVGTYQRDRKAAPDPTLRGGFLSRQKLSKWHVGIDNTFYYGKDLMPLYESSYGGVQYGSDLYFGEECFHTQVSGSSWCDQLTVCYEPEITDFLSVRVASVFHFGASVDGIPVMRGTQQVVSLHLNLSSLRPQPKPVRRASLREFFFGHLF